LEAHRLARSVECDQWEFAVAASDLVAAGMTESVIRWLLFKRYVEQQIECTTTKSARRVFRPVRHRAIMNRSCIVLTDRGAQVVADAMSSLQTSGSSSQSNSNGTAQNHARPRWNAQLRELRMGEILVKRFRCPAPDQELVLSSFQELGWPTRLDDPLPCERGINRKKRIHDTIMRLNRHQKSRLIRFSGDGTGEAIFWNSPC
jgi:hypothetical protein